MRDERDTRANALPTRLRDAESDAAAFMQARLAINLARIHALQSLKEGAKDVGSTSSPLMTAQEEPSQ